MLDYFLDNLYVFLGILIVFVPLLRELVLKKKYGSYFFFLLISLIVLSYLGYKKTKSDNKKDELVLASQDSVRKISINVTKISDSITSFKTELKQGFHILDSSNKPIIEKGYHLTVVTINHPRDVIFKN